jgi:hypothetical protein
LTEIAGDRPRLLIVAGPNGSGKTTLTSRLRAMGLDFGEYINADDIALGLPSGPERDKRLGRPSAKGGRSGGCGCRSSSAALGHERPGHRIVPSSRRRAA